MICEWGQAFQPVDWSLYIAKLAPLKVTLSVARKISGTGFSADSLP